MKRGFDRAVPRLGNARFNKSDRAEGRLKFGLAARRLAHNFGGDLDARAARHVAHADKLDSKGAAHRSFRARHAVKGADGDQLASGEAGG